MVSHSRGLPVSHAVSAGGVVYRGNSGTMEVVVCHSAHRDIWALPKGTPDQGESTLETALREVREETGLEVVSERELDSIDYWFVQDRHRVHKVVHFWLMRPVGGSLDDHDHEFDLVVWKPVDAALDMLTYKGERDMVELAMSQLGAGV